MLEIVNIEKRYGTTAALDGVSFNVNEGEIFGLLGPNGAGKTTLLSIIAGLLEPTAGECRLHGQTLKPSDRESRRLLGIVPQELALYEELTARENLHFIGRLYDIERTELYNRSREILELVGLSDRANQKARTFSGGMKRRLNLGLALMHRPKLLLLDEPTTGVDPQSRNHIFEGVRRLNAEGMTIMYTSHYMEEVQALCSCIGIIDHGKLIACDELPSLLHQLQGLIRVRVPDVTGELLERLRQLGGANVRETDEQTVEVKCRDVKPTVIQVVTLLNEMQIELSSLETEEPNLERVFLHLTGRALRD